MRREFDSRYTHTHTKNRIYWNMRTFSIYRTKSDNNVNELCNFALCKSHNMQKFGKIHQLRLLLLLNKINETKAKKYQRKFIFTRMTIFKRRKKSDDFLQCNVNRRSISTQRAHTQKVNGKRTLECVILSAK